MENIELNYGTIKIKFWNDALPDIHSLSFRKHFHTEYELYYMLSGDLEYQIEQELYKVNPNDALFIRPGQHHNVILKSQVPYNRIVIRFGSSDIQASLERQLRTIPTVFSINDEKTIGCFRKLIELKNNTIESCVPIALKSQVSILLCRLCSTVEKGKDATYISPDLSKVIEYIENNFMTIETENDICQNTNMSSSALRKLFIQYLKTPVMSYVRTKKCMKANEMIERGLPLKQVYRDCGFTTYSTFYRNYLKVYSRAPASSFESEEKEKH